MDDAPLILTVRFDDVSFAIFDAARRRHFPAKQNFIPAHLTLFHKIPGEARLRFSDDVGASAARTPPLSMTVTGLRFLGYGSAYRIECAALSSLRAELVSGWSDSLTRQDAEPFQPHVTIQNKAPARAARTLFEELNRDFVPFSVTATGLLLWRYMGGPWEAAGEFAFRG